MNYSIFIGFLASLELGWESWIFIITILEIIFISFSAYMALNQSNFKKYDNENKRKIIFLAIAFISILVMFGIFGLITFLLSYFITISFISDYRLDEKE